MWTLFVLDMDSTYEMETTGEDVKPIVYLIPYGRRRDVEHYAFEASRDASHGENTVQEYFEEWLGNNNVDFRVVGEIDLPYGVRQTNYLADDIPRMIV